MGQQATKMDRCHLRFIFRISSWPTKNQFRSTFLVACNRLLHHLLSICMDGSYFFSSTLKFLMNLVLSGILIWWE